DQAQPATHFANRAHDRCDTEAFGIDEIGFLKGRAADLHAGARRNTGAHRDRRLDGIAGFDVEPMKPRCCEPGERGVCWKAALRSPEAMHRVRLEASVDVDRRSKASPARAAQVPPIESSLLCFLKRERTAEKRARHVGVACHRSSRETAERRRSRRKRGREAPVLGPAYRG